MAGFRKMFASIEANTGLSVTRIRSMSPGEIRRHFEKKTGKPMVYVSEYPSIGRGNVLSDRAVTRSQINASIDKILGR